MKSREQSISSARKVRSMNRPEVVVLGIEEPIEKRAPIRPNAAKRMAAKKLFKQAVADLPHYFDFDPAAHKTIEDLVATAKSQLDLIEESQDGTEDEDPKLLKRWLKKYSGS